MLNSQCGENNNNTPGTQNKQDNTSTAVRTLTAPRNAGNFKENKRPTEWDNPKTSPNNPYPGNTKDSLGNSGTPQPGTHGNPAGGMAGNAQMASSFASVVSAASSSGVMSSTSGGIVTSSSDLFAGDPDLSQIIQQATELQHDFSSGQLYDPQTEDFNKLLEGVGYCKLLCFSKEID